MNLVAARPLRPALLTTAMTVLLITFSLLCCAVTSLVWCRTQLIFLSVCQSIDFQWLTCIVIFHSSCPRLSFYLGPRKKRKKTITIIERHRKTVLWTACTDSLCYYWLKTLAKISIEWFTKLHPWNPISFYYRLLILKINSLELFVVVSSCHYGLPFSQHHPEY